MAYGLLLLRVVIGGTMFKIELRQDAIDESRVEIRAAEVGMVDEKREERDRGADAVDARRNLRDGVTDA